MPERCIHSGPKYSTSNLDTTSVRMLVLMEPMKGPESLLLRRVRTMTSLNGRTVKEYSDMEIEHVFGSLTSRMSASGISGGRISGLGKNSVTDMFAFPAETTMSEQADDGRCGPV